MNLSDVAAAAFRPTDLTQFEQDGRPMRSRRAILLWGLVLGLSVLSVVLTELWLGDTLSLERLKLIGHALFVANLAVAIFGIWKNSWPVWAAYLVISLGAMLVFGTSTPVTALWIIARLLGAGA